MSKTIVTGNRVEIHINHKNKVYISTIDIDDLDLIEGRSVFLKNGYACIYKNRKRYLLHRLIAKRLHHIPVDKTIDHIDGNPLNNNSSNLRIASYSLQNHNTKKRGFSSNFYYVYNDGCQYIAKVKPQFHSKRLYARFESEHEAGLWSIVTMQKLDKEYFARQIEHNENIIINNLLKFFQEDIKTM